MVSAIRRTSVNVTGGELRTGSGDIIMSTLAKRDYAGQFADVVVIARADGSLVRLGDIARLHDSLLEHDTVTTVNGVPTIFLQVKVSADTSPQKASAQVRDYLAGFEAADTVGVAIWEDETWAVEDRTYLIIKNGIFGLILVFAALMLLFDLRIATWVALGVPVVFVASLIVFPFFGLTLNVITLFAFFILIGIVVDDAIVVGENIATHRDRGATGAEGAIAGAREVIAPIAVGAFTTMAAFATLLPLDGVIGQMFAVIPDRGRGRAAAVAVRSGHRPPRPPGQIGALERLAPCGDSTAVPCRRPGGHRSQDRSPDFLVGAAPAVAAGHRCRQRPGCRLPACVRHRQFRPEPAGGGREERPGRPGAAQ